MPFSFPASPTVGQVSSQNGRTYVWTSLGTWELSSNVAGHAAAHGSAGSDPVALAASQITSGTVAPARLGSGTANSTTFLRGDGQWAAPTGGTVDVIHPFLLMGG